MSSSRTANGAANATLRLVGVDCSARAKTDDLCFSADLLGDFVGDEDREVAVLDFVGDEVGVGNVLDIPDLSVRCI